MKIGICTNYENLENAYNAGFDYVEFSVANIASKTDEEFLNILKLVEASKIKPIGFNCLFPGNIKLVGDEVDFCEIEKYLDNAFARIKKLGALICAFGSGGARNVPEGYDRQKAFGQLTEVARLIAKMAEKYDILIVVEPLNKGETNMINTLSDGCELVKAVNQKSFMLLCDWYHHRVENEGATELLANISFVKHTHIACPNGRGKLLPNDGGMYEEFFAALADSGYEGFVSYEGKIESWDDMRAMQEYMRELSL